MIMTSQPSSRGTIGTATAASTAAPMIVVRTVETSRSQRGRDFDGV